MKTALLALFFLLFVFYRELIAQEVVLDVHDNPVTTDRPYHIREAANPSLAASLDQIGDQTCPISVVLSIDPKQVIFRTDNNRAEVITTEQRLSIEFSLVPECAGSSNWTLQADNISYPIVIGPPKIPLPKYPFNFVIRKARDQFDAYNLFFFLDGFEQALATQPYNEQEELLVLMNPCSEKALKVKFYLPEDCYSNHVRNSFI